MSITACTNVPIAVFAESWQRYGCPHCGFDAASEIDRDELGRLMECLDCNKQFLISLSGAVIVCVELKPGRITVADVQSHPRFGIPKHQNIAT